MRTSELKIMASQIMEGWMGRLRAAPIKKRMGMERMVLVRTTRRDFWICAWEGV